MIWKTIKSVIWDAATPFYISMEDGSVYNIREVKDPYEDRTRIESEEVKDISKIELYDQLDLWIITYEQFEKLIEKEQLELTKNIRDREDSIKKFKILVDELKMLLDLDAMKLLRDYKDLL